MQMMSNDEFLRIHAAVEDGTATGSDVDILLGDAVLLRHERFTLVDQIHKLTARERARMLAADGRAVHGPGYVADLEDRVAVLEEQVAANQEPALCEECGRHLDADPGPGR